jgi:Dolichyl-phosphate-mannose-protein mannosyltransferase
VREPLVWILGVGAVVGAAAALGAGVDIGSILLVLFFAVLVSFIAGRMASKADRTWLLGLVLLGFLAKVAGSIARYLALVLVFGYGDATGYHAFGAGFAQSVRDLDFQVIFDEVGNRSVRTTTTKLFVTGIYSIYTPSLLGGFIMMGSLGFLGQIGFYAALRRWVQPQQLRRYAVGLFFLPTIVFWPSSVGKDAFMLCFLGLATWGISMTLAEFQGRHLLVTVIGVGLGALIRPHVAMLLVASAAVAILLGKAPVNPGASRRRWIVLALLTAGLAAGAPSAAGLLDVELTSEGVEDLLERQDNATTQGGSEVSGEVVRSPADFPAAALRVLFRPLPNEATDVGTALSSVEGFVLLTATLLLSPRMIRGLRHVRAKPFLLFALVYVIGFVIAFSTVFNLGILARQRAQVMPLFLVILVGLGLTGTSDRHRTKVIDLTPVEESLDPVLAGSDRS